jgi:hypothetical protein
MLIFQVHKENSDPLIPLLIGGAVFLALGIIFLFKPERVRKYDTRLTRLIKNEGEYRNAVTVFGAILVLIAVAMLAIAVTFV